MGIWMAIDSKQLNNYHCHIGIVVVACLIVQPITGFIHHSMFKKTEARTVVSYGHIWWGIIFITLGIINAGLGLQLSHEKVKSTYIVYGVLAGVIWLAWMIISAVTQLRKKKSSSFAGEKTEGEIHTPLSS
jgi:hypothetical protein